MGTPKEARPLASPEHEKYAQELFPISMSPEEYVARFGSSWGCCSFPSYSYRNKKLDEWLQRFDDLMRSPRTIEKLREQFLTSEEDEF
jgi:hypothetical protein